MRGIVDYSQSRIMDADWWRRYHILIRRMAVDDDLGITDRLYQLHLALIGNSGITEESFHKAQEHAQSTFLDYVSALRPWAKIDKKAQEEQVATQARSDFVELFGDPADPEWQARLQKELEDFRKSYQEQQHTESDEDRIKRLQAARESRLAQLRDANRKRRLQQGR